MSKFNSKLVASRMAKRAALHKFADMYTDITQKILDEIHSTWGEDMDLQQVFSELPEFKKFVMAMAKLNYQTQNGGLSQWIDNGYAADTADELENLLSEIDRRPETRGQFPTLIKVKRILSQAQEALDCDWSEAQDKLKEADSDERDLDQFTQWFENSRNGTDWEGDLRDIVERIEEICDISKNVDEGDQVTLGYKFEFSGVETSDVYYAEESGEFDSDVYFKVLSPNGTTNRYSINSMKAFLGKDEFDECEKFDELNSTLDDLIAFAQDANSEFNNRGTGDGDDPSGTLDMLSGMYYRLDQNLLWKEVAHFAEMLGEESDFDQPGMGAPEEAAMTSSMDKTSDDHTRQEFTDLSQWKSMCATQGLTPVEIEDDVTGGESDFFAAKGEDVYGSWWSRANYGILFPSADEYSAWENGEGSWTMEPNGLPDDKEQVA